MNKTSDRIRAALLGILLLVSFIFCGIKLMKFQIVDGEKYLNESIRSSVGTQTINAARGEIVDSKGIPIVENKVGFNVIVECAFFPSENAEQNKIILEVVKLLKNDGLDWVDTLPITKKQPYEFLPDRQRDITTMLDDNHLRLAVYATAEDCIEAIVKKFDISTEYSQEEQRIIAGVRYEMFIRNFSYSNRYTFAEDIPMDTVAKIKELSYKFPGVDIVEEAIRVYAEGDILPQSIGTVGPIYAEEFAALKNEGYRLNDTLGKSGIEKAMEKDLRGKDGTRQVTISNGTVTSVDVTKEAIPGNTVKLTIDTEFQRKVQEILAGKIERLHSAKTKELGNEANAGAVVVLDVKTGAVLAMVNYPTYDINDYLKNYSEVAKREGSPLINRAIDGLYRPGSTFKTVTATAALNEGIITDEDTVVCNRVYRYYNDIAPTCTGWHNHIAVSDALKVSCNVFFYDVGRRTGIDNIQKYAGYYGLGENLGLEIGGTNGYIAGPNSFEKLEMDWTPGQVLQTAIGQSETQVTPLQMAVQAATIANEGVRYKPYLVDSVNSYNLDKVVRKTEPTVESKIHINNEKMYDAIEKGMIMAAATGGGKYTLNGLPGTAAIKTGTPESPRGTDSAFVGYYPTENPEIAFSGMIEGG
ncbi:MAG: penicillin-binding transpeptidase domain-containing protein, partial [Oscillospiraceae bacterium]